MPKREASSDAEEEPKQAKGSKTAAKPAKKAKASPSPQKGLPEGLQTNTDGDSFIQLSSNKRLTVRKYKGMTLVDIRETYEKDGQVLPGKKGISISPEVWEVIKSNFDYVDQAISEL